MDYERVARALAEMLDIGYTPEWISYLMEMYGVPITYERPKYGKSKYLFCKGLFESMYKDNPALAKRIVVDIAAYVIESERFDARLKAEALRHLPVFRNILSKAGFRIPHDRSIKINPIFDTRDFELNSRLCFVLMPFSLPWSARIYLKVLKPIIEKCSLEVMRADDFFGQDILEDIWAAINSASIIIADVSGRNANVFYELGIAHTLGKNVILLTQNKDDVPFDIQRFRCIEYADNKDGYEILEEQLPKFINQFSSPYRYSS
jgi:hypothetical protein